MPNTVELKNRLHSKQCW